MKNNLRHNIFYEKLIYLLSKKKTKQNPHLFTLKTFTGVFYLPDKVRMLRKINIIPALGLFTVKRKTLRKWLSPLRGSTWVGSRDLWHLRAAPSLCECPPLSFQEDTLRQSHFQNVHGDRTATDSHTLKERVPKICK